MATRIRLRRVGRKKQASFRIVVAGSMHAQSGRITETIGKYNPRTHPAHIEIDEKRALFWLRQGAKASESVESLLRKTGIMRKHAEGAEGEGVVTLGDARSKTIRPPEGPSKKKAKAAGAEAPAEATAEAAAEASPEVTEEAETPAEPQVESEAAPQAEAETELQAEAETELQAVAEPEPQAEAPAEPQAEAEPEPQAEASAEPQATAEPESGEEKEEPKAEATDDSDAPAQEATEKEEK